ncbi:MAG: hypothetical protein AB7S81_08090 [Bdellovibrionales bacterium]
MTDFPKYVAFVSSLFWASVFSWTVQGMGLASAMMGCTVKSQDDLYSQALEALTRDAFSPDQEQLDEAETGESDIKVA